MAEEPAVTAAEVQADAEKPVQDLEQLVHQEVDTFWQNYFVNVAGHISTELHNFLHAEKEALKARISALLQKEVLAMSQPLFGTGLLTLTPNLSGAVTPVVVAVLQEITLDIGFKVVNLLGNLQFPVDKAKGEGSLTGKFKTGYFAGGLINAILSGSTVVAGSKVAVMSESFTLAAGTYTTTKGALTVPGASGDLGVFDVTANKFLTAVVSGPASGQYVPATASGVITFSATDNTHIIQVSYLYAAAAQGTTIALTNQMMGANTTFQMKLNNNYSAAASGANIAANAGLFLPVVTVPKLSLAFKNTGFAEKNVDFECSADAAGNVCTLYTGN